MKVTENEVTYVSDLANLELTADERTRMVKDLNSILEFIDTLSELDTSNIEPMAQVMVAASIQKDGAQFSYARREDDVRLRPSLPHEAALKNSPQSNKVFFKVPKVIER